MRDKEEWERTYALEDQVKAANKKIDEAVALRVQAGNALLINNLRRFATWVPGMFPMEKGCHGEDPVAEELNEAPFVSESYLYALLGKEEARTFIALFRDICEAVGVKNYHELQTEFYEKREAEKKEKVEREARVRANTIKYKLAGHTFQQTGGCKVCVEKYGVEDLKKRYGEANADRCIHWPLRKRAEALTAADLKEKV